MLRVEDLDAARTARGAVEAMFEDLAWLGLDWDEGPGCGGPHAPYFQNERAALYRAAFERLREDGQVYPCACSRKEVETASQAPHGAEPVYPGTCRELAPDAVIARAKERGRTVSWRFRATNTEPVTVRDLIAGDYTQDVAREVGDFVVVRADGVAAYQLAVVVDDIAMEVTEVVRGDDLLASTPRQVLLYEALGASPPRWAHLPLVFGDDGARLAKRHGAMGLRGLRATGTHPESLRAWILDSLGVSAPHDRPLRELAGRFDFAHVPREAVCWAVVRA